MIIGMITKPLHARHSPMAPWIVSSIVVFRITRSISGRVTVGFQKMGRRILGGIICLIGVPRVMGALGISFPST